MFRKRNKILAVPVSEYTDFSHRVEGDAYATKKTVAIAAIIPTVASAGLLIHRFSKATETYSSTNIPVFAPVEPTLSVLAQSPTILPTSYTVMISPIPENTGLIADASLNMLATVLDPLIQIMVAISFPIASVIMVGACFMFMFNNSEKAWDMIMKAGLGYVLIQLSPLFLQILHEVGKAV
ncbi:hypothetical protein ACFVR1_03405 [Psychrobacillus sp. NPDC058041]|uniref:hypothetical protein n=1 Tax=Psychrobacillus sp. NPDC058041 TaxID=3346310 RepID=UPI0036DAFE49